MVLEPHGPFAWTGHGLRVRAQGFFWSACGPLVAVAFCHMCHNRVVGAPSTWHELDNARICAHANMHACMHACLHMQKWPPHAISLSVLCPLPTQPLFPSPPFPRPSGAEASPRRDNGEGHAARCACRAGKVLHCVITARSRALPCSCSASP